MILTTNSRFLLSLFVVLLFSKFHGNFCQSTSKPDDNRDNLISTLPICKLDSPMPVLGCYCERVGTETPICISQLTSDEFIVRVSNSTKALQIRTNRTTVADVGCGFIDDFGNSMHGTYIWIGSSNAAWCGKLLGVCIPANSNAAQNQGKQCCSARFCAACDERVDKCSSCPAGSALDGNDCTPPAPTTPSPPTTSLLPTITTLTTTQRGAGIDVKSDGSVSIGLVPLIAIVFGSVLCLCCGAFVGFMVLSRAMRDDEEEDSVIQVENEAYQIDNQHRQSQILNQCSYCKQIYPTANDLVIHIEKVCYFLVFFKKIKN